MAPNRSGLLSLTLLGRLLVEFPGPKLGEDAGFFTSTLETAQGGIEILVLANTNAGHSYLNIRQQSRRHSATGGRILKCGPVKGKGGGKGQGRRFLVKGKGGGKGQGRRFLIKGKGGGKGPPYGPESGGFARSLCG